MGLRPILREWQKRIEDKASAYGLDFFPTVYEEVDYEELNKIAGASGFPKRYNHWSFGQEELSIGQSFKHGLSRIYEMVINNDPCIAYLLKSNALVDQKMVMAHVYGHCDFFKNNQWFAPTRRDMLDQMGANKKRVQRHIDEHGFEKVERFIDSCNVIGGLIDIHAPMMEMTRVYEEKDDEIDEPDKVRKLKPTRQYLDSFVNPDAYLKRERDRIEERNQEKKDVERGVKIPGEPTQDVLGFLLNHAPLEDWQRDILGITREEAYYFAPQGQTKILNEGWASYWTSVIGREIVDASEVIQYAKHLAGTLLQQKGRLNPYKLGLSLLRNIEERWDKGQHGRDWLETLASGRLEDLTEWDTEEKRGREKIFEVRKSANDITLVGDYFTQEFCREEKYYLFNVDDWGVARVTDIEFEPIKSALLTSMSNGGRPVIKVVDGNHRREGELLLEHVHDGRDLDLKETSATLKHLRRLWDRDVYIKTFLGSEPSILHNDQDGKLVKTGD